jgi:hypothetical protein
VFEHPNPTLQITLHFHISQPFSAVLGRTGICCQNLVWNTQIHAMAWHGKEGGAYSYRCILKSISFITQYNIE